MKKRTKIILSLVSSLIICSIIGVTALSNPIPEEPDDISPDTWNYYKGRPANEAFLLKNKNVILFFLFFCLILYDVILLVIDYRKEEKLE